MVKERMVFGQWRDGIIAISQLQRKKWNGPYQNWIGSEIPYDRSLVCTHQATCTRSCPNHKSSGVWRSLANACYMVKPTVCKGKAARKGTVT